MGFKVVVNTDKIKRLQGILGEPMNKSTANLVGKELVKLIRGSALKGFSPIAGKGKFPSYKPSYKRAIQSGRFPGKSVTPVNLKVSGDFLSSLKQKVTGSRAQRKIILFFTERLSDLKEKGHRKGANSQKKRPLLPLGNEKFNRAINRTLLEIVVAKLNSRLQRVR